MAREELLMEHRKLSKWNGNNYLQEIKKKKKEGNIIIEHSLEENNVNIIKIRWKLNIDLTKSCHIKIKRLMKVN